jgi:hypothetical protein
VRTHPLTLLSILLGVLASSPARGQDEPPAQPRFERLYLGNNILVGSTRVVALGGAYTAVGEGVAGFTSNLAALAHRAPHLERNWDVGFTLSWQDVPLFAAVPRDLDNDGVRDDARYSAQFLLGLLLQYERFGVGTYLRSMTRAFCGPTSGCPSNDVVRVRAQHAALAGAVAIGRDDFILGVGIYAAELSFLWRDEQWRYAGNGLELDLLYRPLGHPYRVGLSVKPQIISRWQRQEGQAAEVAGRQLYSAVVSPEVLSLGGAWRFGEGAHNFNRLSPAARREVAHRLGTDSVPPALPANAPDGRWLLTFQADLVAPAENTVSLSELTGVPGEVPVGRGGLLIPRLGVEHETLPGRLRSRLGTFLEASPFPDVAARAHLTGGAEVFLFHYYDDLAVSVSFDVAARYHYVGLSLGFWR